RKQVAPGYARVPVLKLHINEQARRLRTQGYSNLTETNFDTPTSCMVTPYNARAVSIVRLLCVITMNCVLADIETTLSVKRPMFSRKASTVEAIPFVMSSR